MLIQAQDHLPPLAQLTSSNYLNTPNSSNISDCPETLASWYCLNGATCFSVKIHESVLYNCWCKPGFQGARCDYKYTLSRQNTQPTGVNRGSQPVQLDIASNNDQLVEANRDRTHHQNDQDPIGALNLGFVEVVKRQQEEELAPGQSRRYAATVRQRLQLDHKPDKGTNLIVFYYLTFLLSVIILIWLIHKLFKSNLLTVNLPASFLRLPRITIEPIRADNGTALPTDSHCTGNDDQRKERQQQCRSTSEQQQHWRPASLNINSPSPASRSIIYNNSVAQDSGSVTNSQKSRHQLSDYSIDLGCARIVQYANLDQSCRTNHPSRAAQGGLNDLNCNLACRIGAGQRTTGQSDRKPCANYHDTDDCNYFANSNNNALAAWARQDGEPSSRGVLHVAASLANRLSSQQQQHRPRQAPIAIRPGQINDMQHHANYIRSYRLAAAGTVGRSRVSLDTTTTTTTTTRADLIDLALLRS